MKEVIIKNRLKKRPGVAALLAYLIHNEGGPKKLSATLTKALGEEISKQRLILWRTRGAVSMPYVKRVAEALGVSPFCLNYIAYGRFSGDTLGWKQAVEKCPKLSPTQKRDILTKKAP